MPPRMRPKSRATRVAFRRAVWGSLALHAVVVCAVALVFRAAEEPERAGPGISTVVDEPQVRISQTEETFVAAEPPKADTGPETGATKPPPEAPPVEAPPIEAPPIESPLPAGPFAPAVPRTLPPELLALIHKPATTPVGGAVVEVAVPPGAVNPPVADANVRPVGGATAKSSATAIHGALKSGQTVVYVLDCSGSMGAAGKFDAARAALVATLRQQPATVRFQVIVYAGTAKPLLATDGNALPASEANVRAASEKLAALEPRGSSDHYGAARAALAFRPDVILMLTDADDLSAAVLKSLAKAIPVCVGQVTAEGVGLLRELK